MDVRKFAVAPTTRLHFLDAGEKPMYADGPDGSPDLSKPMVANLYGPGSKQFAKAQAEQQNLMLEKLRSKGKVTESEEAKRELHAMFLAACTESFENIDYDSLQGPALFKAVYSDIGIGFLAEQASKRISDWANFQKGSTTS